MEDNKRKKSKESNKEKKKTKAKHNSNNNNNNNNNNEIINRRRRRRKGRRKQRRKLRMYLVAIIITFVEFLNYVCWWCNAIQSSHTNYLASPLDTCLPTCLLPSLERQREPVSWGGREGSRQEQVVRNLVCICGCSYLSAKRK